MCGEAGCGANEREEFLPAGFWRYASIRPVANPIRAIARGKSEGGWGLDSGSVAPQIDSAGVRVRRMVMVRACM